MSGASPYGKAAAGAARFTLALYSMLGVLTKLMSFSAEAPRPTAANADQGASAQKKAAAGAKGDD